MRQFIQDDSKNHKVLNFRKLFLAEVLLHVNML